MTSVENTMGFVLPGIVVTVLLALLVALPVTLGDYVAESDRPVLNGTGLLSQENLTVSARFSPNGTPNIVGSSRKTSSESGIVADEIDNPDYYMDIFGEAAALDFQPKPIFEEPVPTTVEPRNSVPLDHYVESPNIVQTLPNGEPFRTPPPLDVDFSENQSDVLFTDNESVQQSAARNVDNLDGSNPKSLKQYEPVNGYAQLGHATAPRASASVAPQTFGPPISALGSSPQAFGPPISALGSPPRVLAPHPGTAYGAPPQTFEPRPDSAYGAPPQTFEPRPDSAYGAPPQTFEPRPGSAYGAPPQAFEPRPGSAYGAPPQAFEPRPDSAYGAPPQAFEPRPDSAYGAPPQAFGPRPDSAYGAPPQAFEPRPDSAYGAPPQALVPAVLGYSEAPVNSYSLETSPEKEEPYKGFLSTLWKTGSVSDAVGGYASNAWKKLTKSVGIKAGKKTKIIIAKAAPLVKKVVGAKAVASFLQSHVGTPKVPPQNPLPAYGAPPQFPDTGYGAPIRESTKPVVETVHNKPEYVAQQHQFFIPEVHVPESDQPVKYEVEETIKYGSPVAPTKYATSDEVHYNVPVAYQQSVEFQGHPGLQNDNPAGYSHVFDPRQQYGPAYVLPQTSHLIHDQDDQKKGKKSDKTKPAKGLFAIIDKARAGYNSVYDTIEYGRNLTGHVTGVLGGFWPLNWFGSTSQPGQAPPAPAAATIVSSYAVPVGVTAPVTDSVRPSYRPVFNSYQSPEIAAEGDHEYIYPVQHSELQQVPLELAYVSTVSGSAAEGKEKENLKASHNGFESGGLGKKKIGGLLNLFIK